MKSSSPYHPYTASDFERYHNGSMPPAERHALEKAALDDPFLADALEGYAATNTPVADMALIRQRLEEKGRKRRGAVWMMPRWWQVAAALVLIGGAGWLVQNMLSTPGTEIAKESVVAPRQSPQADPPATRSITADSATPATPEAGVVTDLAARQPPALQKRTLAASKRETNNTRSAGASLDSGRSDVSIARSEAVALTAAPAQLEKDSAATAQIQAKDVPGVVISKDSISNLNVVLRANSNSNNELKEVNLRARRSKAKLPEPVAEDLEPAGGWVTYNVYIAENIREPRDFKQNSNVSGSVELSFEVDKEGAPVNIKVERSLCTTCDEEAIRLLKEGPKWKLGKKKKGKILIRF